MILRPHLEKERSLWQEDFLVIGVDEVGRGALAGPVYVGFVILRPGRKYNYENIGINDSKKLSAQKRQRLDKKIRQMTLVSLTCFSTVEKVNAKGIVKATERAVREGIQKIRQRFPPQTKFFLLIDGFAIKNIRGLGLKNQRAIIKGDSICISIAAASIIAKVERDRVMSELASEHPHYYWNLNKGYGTKAHRDAVRTRGITKHHRLLFVRKIVK